jgi:putative DNA primase/helicase
MPAELLSGSGDAYRAVLLDGGLYIAPGAMARNHLTSYIQGTHTAVRARCTDRTGWHGAAFVLPDRVIGDQGRERVIFQSAVGATNYYGTAGTLEDWQREIAALCRGNSRLTFSVSTAFASVLLDLLGDENGGVHLQGPSSEGKSAACYAAASVYGGRDYLHRWRATTNGLEAIATAHSGALLILDEIGQVDPREAGEIAYMLANGTGKHRAERSGGARRAPSWRVLLLSTGEIDLAQHMLSAGKRARAGQEVRLLSVPANPGSGLGIYETLHGFANGAELSKAIDARTRRYHGTAGPAFIDRVANEIEQLPVLLRSVRMSFLDAHLPGEASGEVHRAADRFALIAVGGELATRFDITGWPAGAAGQAAASCFRAWIDGRGGTGSRETAAILSQVRRFFEAHGEARFHNWDTPNERPIVNRAGVRKRDGETWTYYVLPETFREDLGAGYDSKAVIQVLDQAGLLIRDKYEGKPAGNVRLPGIGMTRCYRIRPFGEQVT